MKEITLNETFKRISLKPNIKSIILLTLLSNQIINEQQNLI
jgi:hypothetical protein